MDQRQLGEWMAFYSQDPWGEDREDWRNGIATAAICNMWRAKKSPPIKPQDFFLVRPPKKPQTLQEQLAAARRFALGTGGQVKQRGYDHR